MKKSLFAILALVLVAGLAACAEPSGPGGVVQSEKPRVESPSVAQTDLDALVDGNNAFAFDLYQVLKKEDGNLFYSPYSISEALAMTWGGARGTTETAMKNTLSFTLPQDRLHPTFNSLDLQLKQRGQDAQGKDDKGFRLNVVNAIWGQKDYTFLPAYLDLLAQNYGAGLRTLDFIGDTEPSRVTINDWVAEQTEQRIKDLLPQGSITNLTRLVLTNAVYFNAAWLHPFNEGATSDGTFNLLGGGTVTVPMMRETDSFGYAEGADYEAVSLPYDGNELSMVVLLPQPGKFTAFEDALDATAVKGIIDKISGQSVALTMPRFEYSSQFGLKGALSTLGMGEAFTPAADLSGMNGERDLFIHDVLHKAFVSVDEEGTEAAAATGVIVGTTSAPASPVEVKIDRPFIYLIRDNATGSIIFVGRVLDPTD